MIKCGKPVLNLEYRTIRYITFGTVLLNIWIIIYSIYLFVAAIKIKIKVGDYINMVSDNDGNVLPTLLALPGLLCLPLNIACIYLFYKVFSNKKQPTVNTVMYAFIMVCIGSIFTMSIMCIMVLSHVYGSHEAMHNGILEAMNNYSSNSLFKTRIDLLQIQFQCCGSKEYKEWYEITWYDTNLMKNNDDKYQTPFSCCSMKSIYPCIHHGIESAHAAYRYSQETNFSLSSHGCLTAVKTKKKSLGWAIIGKIFLLMLFQLFMVFGARFVQTAHFEKSRFDDALDATYLSWLIGCYVGKRKKVPPPVPPVPTELMDGDKCHPSCSCCCTKSTYPCIHHGSESLSCYCTKSSYPYTESPHSTYCYSPSCLSHNHNQY